MKMIYSSESSFLANNVKNIMEAQQIDTFIKNEFSQGAVGEISAFDAWPEVWVFNDEDYERALTIVEGIVAKLNDQTGVQADWVCQQCSEKNDPSFEICWSCQDDRG